MTAPRITFPGDACLAIEFAAEPGVIDEAINSRCVALATALGEASQSGVRDIVPGFYTVLVHFDPLRTERKTLEAGVQRAILSSPSDADDVTAPIEIPVRYGGQDGPDISDVAVFGSCSVADLIRIHSETIYRVYMLGFLPGFAYLGSVDRRIAMPRLATPRVKVPAGSVGIAGAQTAIYPCDTPGGWRIIGRTSIVPFDQSRSTPSLFRPGQRVRFVPA